MSVSLTQDMEVIFLIFWLQISFGVRLIVDSVNVFELVGRLRVEVERK